MKIEDLIELLKNRLQSYKLSRDYAFMSGDIDRVNAADVEISGIEDTLYKLNLLVDASETATEKDTTVTDVMASNTLEIVSGYDITLYATDPLHETKINEILDSMGEMNTVADIDSYIKSKYPSSFLTGQMIMRASGDYSVDVRLMMAIMELDSRFGTSGIAVRTLNPGNVGNDDDGNTRTYGSWQEGVTAVAEWLNRHRVSTDIPEVETTEPEPVATSTTEVIIPTATSTPSISTTTPNTTSTTTSANTSTTTPITIPTTISTTTPTTTTSTPPIPESTSPATTTSTTTTSTNNI